MNSIRHLLATASLTAVAVGVSVTTATAGPPDKGNVCHRDGSGWNVINIAEPAFDSHIEHGDAFPGEPVPGLDNYVFDGDCVPQAVVVDTDGDGVPDDVDQCPGFDDTVDVDGLGVPDYCERLWAIVYDDSSGAVNGSYDLGTDYLLVKLMDDGDGLLGAGDIVYAGDYQITVTGLTPVPFQVKLHTVETVTTATASRIVVSTAEGVFEFATSDLEESYSERSPLGWTTTLRDSINDPRGTDLVLAQVGSPSAPLCLLAPCPPADPETIILNESAVQPGDQTFLNVDIDLTP